MKWLFNLPVSAFPFRDTADTIAADTEAAAFIPEIWANQALGRLRSSTIMVQLVVRDYDDEVANYGATVNVRKRGTITTNNKLPNTTVTLQNPTASLIPVVLTTHKEVSFLVEDVASAQADMDIVDGYVEDGAIAIGDAIDISLLGEYANVDEDNALDVTDAGITHDDILEARTALKITGKSGKRPRYLVVRDLAELLKVEEFINADYVSDGSLEEGAIGKISGFQVYEDENVITTTSPSQTHRLALVQGGLALVVRRLPDPPAGLGVKSATVVEDGLAIRILYGYNMNYLGTQVTMDILFGQKILRSEWIAEIR